MTNTRRRPSSSPLMTLLVSTTTCVAGALAGPLAPEASAAPAIYHSPADDGAGDATPALLPADPDVVLHLWIRDDGATPSNAGTVCRDANGDERCGWAVTVDVSSMGGDVEITDFQGAAMDVVVGPPSPTRVVFNGGNYTSGALGPEKLGDLHIDAPPNSEGLVELTGLEVVTADMQTATVLEDPAKQKIAYVPEPAGWMGWLAGGGLLARLGRRRARR